MYKYVHLGMSIGKALITHLTVKGNKIVHLLYRTVTKTFLLLQVGIT